MSKRTRRQRQCREIYEAAGFEAWTPDATMYGDNDIFNHFDILAVRPETIPRLVQVSTNRTGRAQWMRDSYPYTDMGFIVSYAQVYSGDGWRLMRPTGKDGAWITLYDEREDDENMGKGLSEWLRHG